MSIIVQTLGGSYLGTLLQTWIYGILTYQYLTYFASDYRDPIWIRAPMAFLLLLNTTHVAFSIYVVWYYGIANFGNAELLFGRQLVWAALAAYLAIPLSAFVAQIFLIFRSYRLLEPYAWRLIPVVFLSLVSLAGCTCGLIFGVRLCMLPSLAAWASLKPWVTTWLTLEMVADCLTAATLARALTTSKASFAGSQRIIKRLFRTAVQTGAFAGAFSVVTMIVFLVYPNTFFAKITAIPIGCVYGVAVMDTLLCRNSLREMLGDVQMGSRATSGGSTMIATQPRLTIAPRDVESARGEGHFEDAVTVSGDSEKSATQALDRMETRSKASFP